ncbi:MAG: NPCBM/NEW2 domain-containing protein [Bacteroidales bacterium]
MAVDDNIRRARPGQKVVYVVRGDGKELWRSAPLGADDAPVSFDIAVTGVKKLELAVESGDDESRFGGLPADWIKPVLTR